MPEVFGSHRFPMNYYDDRARYSEVFDSIGSTIESHYKSNNPWFYTLKEFTSTSTDYVVKDTHSGVCNVLSVSYSIILTCVIYTIEDINTHEIFRDIPDRYIELTR